MLMEKSQLPQSKRRTTSVRRFRSLHVEALEMRSLLALVPQLVADINTGTASAFLESGNPPGPVTVMNGVAYFAAQDGAHGVELWKSDGTAAGTQVVKDIRPGIASSTPGLSGPLGSEMVAIGNSIFFSADDGTNGYELWKSDGTAAGTVLVKDIWPGTEGSNISRLTNVNGTLFFVASEPVSAGGTSLVQYELWKSDGTAAGTILVKDIIPGDRGSDPTFLTNVNGTLFFSALNGDYNSGRRGLWKSDGSTSGTVMIKNGNDARDMANVNGTLLFVEVGGSDRMLWKSDGTAAGTVLVKNIGRNMDFQQPTLTAANGTLFFVGHDAEHGFELWKSDGTVDGTVMVKDVRPGNADNFFGPRYLTNVNGAVFFDEWNGTTSGLWKSDGTTAGTILVSGNIGTTNLTNINGTLFFNGSDGIHGNELWKSDGTLSGTIRVADIALAAASSSPDNLRALPGGLIFTANDGVHGRELWILGDGSAPFAPHKSVKAIQETPQAVTVSAIDTENDPLTYRIVDQPQHGTLTGNAPNLTYTPAANYVGPDVFTFVANDGINDSNKATVSITVVSNKPTANNVIAATTFNKGVAVVLAASDPRNLPLTYIIGTGPSRGILSGTAPNLVYTPELDYVGPDNFTYQVSNGQSTSAAASVSVTVAIGAPPLAANKTVQAVVDISLTVMLDATDADSHPLTYRIVNQPQHGILTGTAPNLTYTPASGYIGLDSFSFVANDRKLDSNEATISITVVSTQPVTQDISASTRVNKPTNVTLVATDPKNLALTYTISSEPLHGTLSGSTPNLIYTPALDYVGPDSFTYQASNGQTTSSSATVSIEVRPNAAPTADNVFIVGVSAHKPSIIRVSASDPDGDSLTYIVATQPRSGSLVAEGDHFVYTPGLVPDVEASFEYQVSDGLALSNVATAIVLLSQYKVTVYAEDGARDIAAAAQELFAEVPPGGSPDLIFTTTNDKQSLFSEQPAIDSTGKLTFTPAPNSKGTATVTVVKSTSSSSPFEGEEGGDVDTATFTIEILQEFPLQNDLLSVNVDNDLDFAVVAWDVLLIINYINSGSPYGVSPDTPPDDPFLDTSGDNYIAPDDVLKVINYINSAVPEQEGESSGSAAPPSLAASNVPSSPPAIASPNEALFLLLATDIAHQLKRRQS